MKIKPVLIPAHVSRESLHISLKIRRRKETMTVALLAPEDPAQADNGRVLIEWLLVKNSNTDRDVRELAHEEIDRYFLEKAEPCPWSYLLYHCGTYSNFYTSENGGIGWKIEQPASHTPNETHGPGVVSSKD